MTEPHSLLDVILAEIAETGPLTIERYMSLCLTHPQFGYYRSHDPIGRAGDFITAPEVCQIFGELIGLWAADLWHKLGRPAPYLMIELGPGRGTLMADAVRAMRTVGDLGSALEVHLVELSAPLRARQAGALATSGLTPSWHDRLDQVPDGAGCVIANEFFDCLPIQQFVRRRDGWHERLIDAARGRLRFSETEHPVGGGNGLAGKPGDITETCPAAEPVINQLCRRLKTAPGHALIVDYGYQGPAIGDTLQAVAAHDYADPLAEPGHADLTAHVDFTALARHAQARGVATYGPVSQGAFLKALGLDLRAQKLARNATAAQRRDIEQAAVRLTAEDQMGRLFKFIALGAPDGPTPAPFAHAEAP
jgi:NADH dehydrogenase [ubiquinone] 1 alpha subcomplex assembly factor 7